jgi:enolase
VRNAIASVTGPLADAVRGLNANVQAEVDARLRAADGTPELSRLGANAVLAVSLANALAAASAARVPLYQYVATADTSALLPLPMVNIISGGAHAGRGLDIQDFLVLPIAAETFGEAIETTWRVRRSTAIVTGERGYNASLIADEGGLGPALPSNRAALELLVAGIERAGLRPGTDVAIGIDVAATQFYDSHADVYELAAEHRRLTAAELIEELRGWCADFPIASIEDPLAEDDWDNWTAASEVISRVQILGDDLFATNASRLRRGVDQGAANAILVKPNQVGTLTEAHNVVSLAHLASMATVLSARSGDTEESWLADLAVGWRVGQIKVGSTMRSERTAKWNRLLEIEARLGTDARFAGPSALAARPNSDADETQLT